MKEHKGYTYTKDGTSDNLQKTYYKCSAYYALKCRARLCEFADGKILVTGQPHICREFGMTATAGPTPTRPLPNVFQRQNISHHLANIPTNNDERYMRIQHDGYTYRKTATSRYQKLGDTEATLVWYYKCVKDCPGGIKRNSDGSLEVTKPHSPECSRSDCPQGLQSHQVSFRAEKPSKSYHYKGYRYRVNKYGNSGELYYRCADYRNSGCLARIKVIGDKISERKQHTCASGRPPSSVEENVAALKSYKGYSYRKDSHGERGQVYYRCSTYRKTGCRARIKVIGDHTSESGNHRHTCRNVPQTKERPSLFERFHGVQGIGLQGNFGGVRSGITSKPTPSATATARSVSAIPNLQNLHRGFRPIKSPDSNLPRSEHSAFQRVQVTQNETQSTENTNHSRAASSSLASLPTVVEKPTGMGKSRDGKEILVNEIIDLEDSDGEWVNENAVEVKAEDDSNESFGSQLPVNDGGVVSEDDGDVRSEVDRNVNSDGDGEGVEDEDGDEVEDGDEGGVEVEDGDGDEDGVEVEDGDGDGVEVEDGDEDEEGDANSECSEDMDFGDSTEWVAGNDGDESGQEEEETNSRGDCDSQNELDSEGDEDINAQSYVEVTEQADNDEDEISEDVHPNIDIEAMENSDNDGDDGVQTPSNLNNQMTAPQTTRNDQQTTTPNTAPSSTSQRPDQKSQASPKSRQTQSPQITQSLMGFEASPHASTPTYNPWQTLETQTPQYPEARETQRRQVQTPQLPQKCETRTPQLPQTQESRPPQYPEARETHRRQVQTPQLPQKCETQTPQHPPSGPPQYPEARETHRWQVKTQLPQKCETQTPQLPQTRESRPPQFPEQRETQKRRAQTPQLPQSSMTPDNGTDALWLRNLGHRVSEIQNERRRKRLKLDIDEIVLRAQREEFSDD